MSNTRLILHSPFYKFDIVLFEKPTEFVSICYWTKGFPNEYIKAENCENHYSISKWVFHPISFFRAFGITITKWIGPCHVITYYTTYSLDYYEYFLSYNYLRGTADNVRTMFKICRSFVKEEEHNYCYYYT